MGDERFGPYTVHECLGAGGMATVHRASVSIGAGVVREVALKRLLPQLADDRQFVGDFIREAKLAAQLDHPNIVHILELGEVGGTYFIAMELVRGQPLVRLLKQAYGKRLQAPIGVVIALISELCEALHYASRGRSVYGLPLDIVHRDLTPSNVVVTEEGHVKIIDFGVAKALSGKFMTSTGLVKGKLGYMSVEALSGSASLDARADLFSLGVIAWELIANRRLFKGVNEYEVITKIRRGEVAAPSVHNADCSPALDAIVLRALARDREARWSSADALRTALDEMRREHGASPAEVVAWKQALIPPVPQVRSRPDTDDEDTRHRPPTVLAEGSQRRPSHPGSDGPTLREVASGPVTAALTARDRAVTLDEELTQADGAIPDPRGND